MCAFAGGTGPGVPGGAVGATGLVDTPDGDNWRFEDGTATLRVSHDATDPQAWTVWEDGRRTGVVVGVLTNLDELGLTHEDVFERLLDGDTDLPALLEGGFLVACYDGAADRWVLVTDKLGARPCYYTRDGFRFADSVSALLAQRPSPAVDRQAVSDFLLMGHLWGDRTLVEGIRALRPATVLEAEGGEVTTERYWKPDYTEAEPTAEYLDELARRYRQAARRTARTLPASAGLWLSGGLDSRTTAAALLEAAAETDPFEQLHSYTYDANPPTSDNPRIAAAVTDRLGSPHDLVDLTAETFDESFERVIEATDGMIQWNVLVNLSATYNVESPPPVMLEGMPGELVGDHPFRYHLEESSAARAQYHSEASATPDEVDSLLADGVDVDPMATFRAEADRSPESTHRGTVLDTHFRNYYSRNVLLSNAVTRQRLGSRTVQVDGDYLDWCASLPRSFRKGTFPLSQRFVQADAGGVPYGTSRVKLGLCRRVAPETCDVRYERTKVRPDRPYPLHAVGFVGNVLVNRLRGRATYGNGQLSDVWIRDTSTGLHDRVAGLIDDACDRALFDADAVREVYDDHMDGANNAGTLANITTLEYWLATHMD
ncbi:MAG: asparagine synthase-related protein [Haloarculaceae archaeon]